MKKFVFVLFAGLLLAPLEMIADKYNSKQVVLVPRPVRTPARYYITMNVDENTGDLAICPNYDITGLTITLTGNGVTYINTTVSLSAGQAYLDSLAGYALGEYTLTLSTADGVIDQYTITVEPD